jgi:hypothetical protein
LDSQLDGASDLTPALRQIVRASAVLVPIVSPGYANSPRYCGEEFVSFRERAEYQKRYSIGNNLLAVRKVVVEPLENDLHNRFPVDEPGYWFFETDAMTKRARTFRVHSDEFDKRLDELADDTAKFLRTLQKLDQQKLDPVPDEDTGATRKEILLACDVSGFDPPENVRLVACVTVDQPDYLSSRMERFKTTLGLDPAFRSTAQSIDRLRRMGLRYENDEISLRDRAADELAVLPWNGHVSFADARFWAGKTQADTILELLHGVLFDRLRGLPDVAVRLILSPRLVPFWQSISKAASDYREQIKEMDSVSVVGTSSIDAAGPKDAAIEIANYLGAITASRLADPTDEAAQRRFARVYPNKLRVLRDLRSNSRFSRHQPMPEQWGVSES